MRAMTHGRTNKSLNSKAVATSSMDDRSAVKSFPVEEKITPQMQAIVLLETLWDLMKLG